MFYQLLASDINKYRTNYFNIRFKLKNDKKRILNKIIKSKFFF